MTKKQSAYPTKLLPKRPIDRFIVPVKSFLHIEAFSGGLLLCCTACCNCYRQFPLGSNAEAFWKTKVSVGIGHYSLTW